MTTYLTVALVVLIFVLMFGVRFLWEEGIAGEELFLAILFLSFFAVWLSLIWPLLLSAIIIAAVLYLIFGCMFNR